MVFQMNILVCSRLGDVLVLDMGLVYKKLFVDSAITVIVGGKACGDEAALKLIAAAEAGLSAAIDMMKPGCTNGGHRCCHREGCKKLR
jgi:methionine aminopeptidase